MTNVSPWTYAHSSFYFASLYYYRTTFAGIINPLFTFLKTDTIPTYYGISIAIPRYIAMQLSTVPFIMTPFIIVIFPLHDHVVDIVFVAKPPFIILSYMSLLIHCISRYTAGGIHIESYIVLALSCNSWVVNP